LGIYTDIWDFYDHLVHFVSIWYIFSGFGIIDQDQSGNPAADTLLVPEQSSVLRTGFSSLRIGPLLFALDLIQLDSVARFSFAEKKVCDPSNVALACHRYIEIAIGSA
jgi:hypothetical protein